MRIAGAGWVAVACAVVACASGARSTRQVDTPVGHTQNYGAPSATAYSFEAEPELDQLTLHVYRASRCPVIPVDIVHRRSETLQGDRVIESVDQGPVQIAKPASGEVDCDLGYGDEVGVSLVVGNAVHRLGTTDARGTLSINLSGELREKLFGAAAPEEATVRLFPPRALGSVDAGQLSLASLRDYQAGVDRLLAELEPLLGKGAAITGPEIQRSYELYEQLRQLAFHDPRVRGALARFWELFYARKSLEATDTLARNLKALDSARELLKSASLASLPLFLRVAVSSQTFDPRALDWSRGELFEALRKSPQVCSSFDFRRVQSYGFGPSTELAVDYLRFAQGDDFWASMSGVCSFVGR